MLYFGYNKTYFVFQNSSRVSEKRNPTVMIIIKACDSKPSRDWCNWLVFTSWSNVTSFPCIIVPIFVFEFAGPSQLWTLSIDSWFMLWDNLFSFISLDGTSEDDCWIENMFLFVGDSWSEKPREHCMNPTSFSWCNYYQKVL